MPNLTLSPAAANVLRTATATEDRIVLTAGQLDRKVYEEVNKALTRIGGGGQWNRHQRAHLFPRDPRPELAQLVAAGEMPVDQDKAMAYFRTPDRLAETMAARLYLLMAGDSVLEPSAGDGSLVTAVRRAHPGVHITAVEPDADRRRTLMTAGNATHVWSLTFEDYATTAIRPGGFDAVVMNPPFAVPGNRNIYVDHIELAWSLTRPGGRLLAIAPSGLVDRKDRKIAALRDRIEHAVGRIERLPDDTFRASGTAVRTVLVDVTIPADE